MEWNRTSLDRLYLIFAEKHYKMGVDLLTDRRNLSEHWNRHLEKNFGIQIIRGLDLKAKDKFKDGQLILQYRHLLNSLLDLINYENNLVQNRVVIKNPDRHGQFLIVPNDIAERILVFGMF